MAEQLGEDIKPGVQDSLYCVANGPTVCMRDSRNKEVDLRKAARAAGRQKSRNDCHERASWCHRLYPRRMFAYRHEETAAHFFDSSALRHDFIFVSAGVRGMQLRMHPQELIDFTAPQQHHWSKTTTMSNILGERVTYMSFGESHGPAVGAILDGISAGIDIDCAYVQRQVDRRKPQRQPAEPQDAKATKWEILSASIVARPWERLSAY